MVKLKINKEAKDSFEEMLKSFPFTERYKSLIEKGLNCSWEEVVCLDIHPDNEKSDASFVADENASPWTVYANPNKYRYYESETKPNT